MQEYWVNVYKSVSEVQHKTKISAILGAKSLETGKNLALYRIHVKMDGGWTKRKKVKLNYQEFSNSMFLLKDKLNWMS